MALYRNIRPAGDVLGVAPGEAIEVALSPLQERQLIRGGHIEKVKQKKLAKGPKAGKE